MIVRRTRCHVYLTRLTPSSSLNRLSIDTGRLARLPRESVRMSLGPRKLPSKLVLAILLQIAAWFIVRPLLDPAPALPSLFTSVGFSFVAFLATLYIIPLLEPTFLKAGLKGKDRAKVYDDDMCVPPVLILQSLSYRSPPHVQSRKSRTRLRSNLYTLINIVHSISFL